MQGEVPFDLGREIGMLLLQEFQLHLDPAAHDCLGHLEMKLEGIDRLADAKGLVAATLAGHQQFGPIGQIEGVLMPFHDPLPAIETGEQGRGRAGFRDFHLGEAQLQLAMAIDGFFEGAGDELGAEANPQNGFLGGMKSLQQSDQRPELWIVFVVEGIHGAPHHDDAVIAAEGEAR